MACSVDVLPELPLSFFLLLTLPFHFTSRLGLYRSSHQPIHILATTTSTLGTDSEEFNNQGRESRWQTDAGKKIVEKEGKGKKLNSAKCLILTYEGDGGVVVVERERGF